MTSNRSSWSFLFPGTRPHGRSRALARFAVALALGGAATTAGTARAQTTTPPPGASALPIDWARWFVQELRPENNQYGTSPSYVTLGSAETGTPTTARTMCNSFVTAMLSRAYGFNENFYRLWTGMRSPTAAKISEVTQAGRLMQTLPHVNDVRPGDLVVIDYGDPTASATGHVAFVEALPVVRYPQSAPLVPDTIQYEVSVIDSARTGHGPTDTRRLPDGSWVPGIGRGVMRLYVNTRGAVVGYAWSTWSTSTYAINGQGTVSTRVARFTVP